MHSAALYHIRMDLFGWLVLWVFVYTAHCLPTNHTDASTNATVVSGTFQNPSNNVRPKFRYWLPDASISPAVLADDIKQIGNLGAGGIEFLPYYLYGGIANQSNGSGAWDYTPVDWSIYGFGTDAYRSVFKTALQAHKDNGLIMDLSLGPNQGQGVPAVEASEGLEWDLFFFNTTVAAGTTYSSVLPGWNSGYGELVAATTGRIVNISIDAKNITIAHDSLQDVTSLVQPTGKLTIHFPVSNTTTNSSTSTNSTGSYYIWAAYNSHSNYRATRPGNNPQTVIQNGSWAVDHFSALGAKTTTDFLEKHVLINGTKELLQAVGNYMWEDSIEIRNNVFWSVKLPQVFLQNRGYSINKYLPLLSVGNEGLVGAGFGLNDNQRFLLDVPDMGQSFVDDYRTTLAEMYREYIEAFNTWAHEYLDIQFSAQVSYNLPMDMLTNVPNVDAPECESLGFNHEVDAYRQYAGPANLAGKRIISSELGAIELLAYQQTMPDILWDVKRSIVGGVNQFIFHGAPYSGDYGNTTWPGFTSFDYMFSEQHQRHQPAWRYYREALLEPVARMQWVLQKGVPRRDVIFWDKESFTNITNGKKYWPWDLVDAGYTYEYLTPENFGLPLAYVSDAVLAPAGPAYKAMILRANDSLTLPGVEKLSEFAHAGLPVIFQGGLPSRPAGAYNASVLASINNTIHSITSLDNVHIISYDDSLASTLQSLDITPFTAVATNGTWFTTHRSDNDTEYVYIYNDSPYSEGTVTFASTDIPYIFDAFTGVQSPVLNYTTTNTTTSIFFQLAANQSAIITFAPTPLPGIATPSTGAHSTDADVLGFALSSTNNDSIVAQVATNNSIVLSNWNLVVSEWAPPSNLSDISIIHIPKTHHFPNLTTLQPWASLPGLQNVSGIGYYSTSFSLPSSTNTSTQPKAYIDFGPIYHTIRVSINNITLPPLDLSWAKTDISTYLNKNGEENRVEAEVATPLWNELRPIWGALRTSGEPPDEMAMAAMMGWQEYGLVGEVVVRPFGEVGVV